MKTRDLSADRSIIVPAVIVWLVSMFAGPGCTVPQTDEVVRFAEVRTLAGGGKEFGEPFGIVVGNGVTYVSDGDRGRIHRIGPDGRTAVLTEETDTPSEIDLDAAGNLIVADTGTHTIKRILPDGRVETVAGAENSRGDRDGPSSSALFNGPVGIAADGGRIYVADTYNDRIRIIENGRVSTLAGGERGFADGRPARFDTPTGLAMWTGGRLLVADAGNRRIRVVEPDGRVWTLAGNGAAALVDGLPAEASFVRPLALTVGRRGAIYVSDGNAIRVIGRRFLPVVETLAGSEQGFGDGRPATARFNRPGGLAFDRDGNLLVADADNRLVRVIAVTGLGRKLEASDYRKLGPAPAEFRERGDPRWTYDPPDRTREIAGTFGEIRGEMESADSFARFHNGLDIAGGYGETAHFIRDEKVLRPLAVQNYGTVRELLRMPTLGYIHIRLGRDVEETPFDDERFLFDLDARGRPVSVRVPRGTRFAAGEAIGTLNRYNHVHLVTGPSGRELNGLEALALPGLSDGKKPQIENVALYDEDWNPFETDPSGGRIRLSGRVRIVVGAYDQIDGNAPRRRLGLYRAGYQILNSAGEPLEAFRKPIWTIEFDVLPEDERVGLVYAPGSRSGARGKTVFRYIVTNRAAGGAAKEDFFDAARLAPGRYILRVFAADLAGNIATRDLGFVIG